jgi:hypothetical protein
VDVDRNGTTRTLVRLIQFLAFNMNHMIKRDKNISNCHIYFFVILTYALFVLPQANCKCGGPFSTKRIVSGDIIPPHSIPFQVAIVEAINMQHIGCGGTLISPNFVITGKSHNSSFFFLMSSYYSYIDR